MSDPRAEAPASAGAPPTVAEEITRAMGSLWQRHAASRPTEITTVVNDDVVKCVFKDAVASFAEGPAPTDGNGAEGAKPAAGRYQTEAIATVTRVTKRRVLGFIPRHDKKTDVATETFILERRRKRN